LSFRLDYSFHHTIKLFCCIIKMSFIPDARIYDDTSKFSRLSTFFCRLLPGQKSPKESGFFREILSPAEQMCGL